jgi:glucose/mannose-6-phosphate isomerase
MMSASHLDNPPLWAKIDPQGMLTCLHELPQRCQQAWQMAIAFNLPVDYSAVDNIVILGMGGSAIGGDLIRSLVQGEVRVPILTYRDYDLPAFVAERTMVIASSHSGNTEETLSAFGQALDTRAKKLVITTGGKLKDLSVLKSIPIFHFDYPVPPRAAIPFSLLPILGLLQRLGLIADKSADVAEMINVLKDMATRINETVPAANNLAKQLAQRLYGKLPIVYGGGILAEVAHRWKTQLNENSKAWAFYEVFPELNHNAVVGYQFPTTLVNSIMLVMLQSASFPPHLQQRYQATYQILKQAKVSYQLVEATGTSQLSQMMGLVMFGDYVSYYLALLHRIDPTPVAAIDYLKAQMAVTTKD